MIVGFPADLPEKKPVGGKIGTDHFVFVFVPHSSVLRAKWDDFCFNFITLIVAKI
jgi:hypothetical protein